MCVAAEVKSDKLHVVQAELAPHLFPFPVHHFDVITPNTTAVTSQEVSPHPWFEGSPQRTEICHGCKALSRQLLYCQTSRQLESPQPGQPQQIFGPSGAAGGRPG